MIESLPPELIVKILSYLQFEDVVRMRRLSMFWNIFIIRPLLWQTQIVTLDKKKANFEALLSKVPNYGVFIRRVILKNMKRSCISRTLIEYVPEIQHLRLVECTIHQDAFRTIGNMENLTVLEFDNCYWHKGKNSDADILLDFRLLKKLKVLTLPEFGLNNSNFDGLLQCNNLQNINMHKIKCISQENLIRFFKKNKHNLKVLHMFGGENMVDEVMFHLAECDQLRSLFIVNMLNLTDASLSMMKQMRSLTSLFIWDNEKLTKHAMIDLFSCKDFANGIEMLNFCKVGCVSKELVELVSENCPNLVCIGIIGCTALVNNQFPYAKIYKMFPKTRVLLVM